MKKLIGSLALAALLAGAAFAEIGLSSWGRVIAAPIASDGKYNITELGTSWRTDGGNTFRTGVNFFGSSENSGFLVEMQGESIATNDQAYMWAKPWDFIQVRIGRMNIDTGRGNGCFGVWDWIRPNDINGEDFTFARNGKKGQGGQVTGFDVLITPIDGLWLEAAVDIGAGAGVPGWETEKAKDNSENQWWQAYVANNTVYAVGYNIPSIGSIRVKLSPWSANNKTTDEHWAVINPAFDLTAVENLYITLGAFIPTNFKKDALNIDLYASYKLDPITIHLLFGTDIVLDNDFIYKGAKDEDISKFGMQIGAGIDVDLGAGFAINADFRYNVKAGKKEGKDDTMSFIVGIRKSLANGYIGVAFEGAGNQGVMPVYKAVDKGVGRHGIFTWSVPVAISMGF